MSFPCSRCTSRAVSPLRISPLCRACEDQFTFGNYGCNLCSTSKPTQVCTCDFPLPILCNACVNTHNEKNRANHAQAPLFLKGVIRSREGLLYLNERAVRIDYMIGKLKESTIREIERAKVDIEARASHLKSFIDSTVSSLHSELDYYVLQTNNLIARLALLKYDLWRSPANYFENFAINERNPIMSVQDLDYKLFYYKFDEQKSPFPSGFFVREFRINATPIHSTDSPVNRYSQRVESSSVATEAQNSSLRPRASIARPVSEQYAAVQVAQLRNLDEDAVAALEKCLACEQKISEPNSAIRLTCGHAYHDKPCLFSHLQKISQNFTLSYSLSCHLCHSYQSLVILQSAFLKSELNQFVERVRQTACCTCGSVDVVVKWKCQHRLCSKHKNVRDCPFCLRTGEVVK